MRPPGEVRQALEDAARKLKQEGREATWRELAEAAKVGYRVAARTVANMENAGVLEVVGSAKRAHSRRWMNVYSPTDATQVSWARQTTAGDLQAVTRAWVAKP